MYRKFHPIGCLFVSRRLQGAQPLAILGSRSASLAPLNAMNIQDLRRGY
jgi:hypothetical protein